MVHYEDSHIRCPRCSKRMMVELGPDDTGRLVALHECWNCDYTIRAVHEVGAELIAINRAGRSR